MRLRVLVLAVGSLLVGCQVSEGSKSTLTSNSLGQVATSAPEAKSTESQVRGATDLYHSIRPGVPLSNEQRGMLPSLEKGDIKLRGKYAEILRKSFETGAMPREEALTSAKRMLANDMDLHQLWQQVVDRMEKQTEKG